MSTPPETSPLGPPRFGPVVIGTAYCLAAAVLYTAANACLRGVAGQAYQPWVICVKEAMTVAAVGPWLLYQGLRGRPVWPAGRTLAALVLVGLAVQLVGNLGLLWALEVIGLSITIPVVVAVNLTFSAVLGRIVLRESVTPRTAGAIGVLIGAIVLLRVGAGQTGAPASGPEQVAWGVGAACLAGAIFATLSVTIRKTVTGATPATTVVFVITGMGVLSLAPLSLWHLGVAGLASTPPRLMAVMLLAGAFNFAAFLSITKGYQYASVVQANVLSTSQIPLAAVAGLLFFAEPPSATVLIGLGLTVVGTLLVQPARRR